MKNCLVKKVYNLSARISGAFPFHKKYPIMAAASSESSSARTAGGRSISDVPRALALLPKVELHAHLGGCLSQEFLKSVDRDFAPADVRELLRDEPGAAVETDQLMEHCFAYFDAVNKVVTDLGSLKKATLHVLEEFAKSNCFYLELRTTPKAFDSVEPVRGPGSTTPPAEVLPIERKAAYIATVREAVDEFNQGSFWSESKALPVDEHLDQLETQTETIPPPRLLVRLLLSIDRGKVRNRSDADRQVDDCLKLATRFRGFVVGLDVCGNPGTDSVVPWVIPALRERAADVWRAGLAITWHLAEKRSDAEVDAML